MQKLRILVFTVSLVLAASVTAYSQDIIVTKKSEKITAKVIEIDADVVKYKQYDHQDGPTYTIKKTEVASIIYQNGRAEVFEPTKEEPKPVPSPVVESKKEQDQPNPFAQKQRRCYLSWGLSGLFINADPFIGGNFAFGVMVSPKNLLILELGGGSGSSEQVSDYSYTYIATNSSGQVINRETRHDGKVSYEYSFFEIMFSWNHVVNLSDKWKFRVGPSLGALVFSAGESYSPTSYKGATIEGLPEAQSESESAFMAGVNAGFQWNFSKRWFLDMNYRFSVNTPVEFSSKTLSVLGRRVSIDGKEFGSIGNRINLSIGVRL